MLEVDHTKPVRALELFCGIGGFAEAIGDFANVVAAVDMAPHLMEVYGLNFPGHRRIQKSISSLSLDQIAALDADLWWMSPPCQPFTSRGLQRGMDDPRALVFPILFQWIAELLPTTVAMENVPGFVGSEAHRRLREVLDESGYTTMERTLCPTELGIPARRDRFYLVASRTGLSDSPPTEPAPRRLTEFLDPRVDESLIVPAEILAKYEAGMRILDPRSDPEAVANTFTSAYGKSWRASGSYLRLDDRRVRFFSPRELLRLLGFSEEFRFPEHTSLRRQYKAIGNSLSIFAMRSILGVENRRPIA
jgi:DNA (cytosine-5)-methyltransferase 1